LRKAMIEAQALTSAEFIRSILVYVPPSLVHCSRSRRPSRTGKSCAHWLPLRPIYYQSAVSGLM
jgi:hypothetical protein